MDEIPDAHWFRAKLAERRQHTAFSVFSTVTNGPGRRARVLEYGSIVFAMLLAAPAAWALQEGLDGLPGWAEALIVIPALLVAFLVVQVSLLPYLAKVAVRILLGHSTGRQWIAPLVLVLLATGTALSASAIGPWWAFGGFWALLIPASYTSTSWAGPAVGRDIELFLAMQEWTKPGGEHDDNQDDS